MPDLKNFILKTVFFIVKKLFIWWKNLETIYLIDHPLLSIKTIRSKELWFSIESISFKILKTSIWSTYKKRNSIFSLLSVARLTFPLWPLFTSKYMAKESISPRYLHLQQGSLLWPIWLLIGRQHGPTASRSSALAPRAAEALASSHEKSWERRKSRKNLKPLIEELSKSHHFL